MISRTSWGDRLNRAREIRSPKLTHMSPISSTDRPVMVMQRTWIPSLASQMARWVESSQCLEQHRLGQLATETSCGLGNARQDPSGSQGRCILLQSGTKPVPEEC